MRVAIQTGRYKLPDTEREKILTTLDQLAEILPDEDPYAEVSVRTHNRYPGHPEAFTVEFQIAPAYRRALRATAHGPDSRSALDLAIERLEHQRRRTHSRLKNRRHLTPEIRKSKPTETPNPAPLDKLPQVVRTKVFDLIPMSVEEAVLQMEMLDHKFFLFYNAETGSASLLYRRNDDALGMIEGRI